MLFLCQLPLKHRRKRHCKQQITTLISATRNVCAGAATSVKRENSCPAYSPRRRWSSQTGHCGGVGTCSWGRGTGGDTDTDRGRGTGRDMGGDTEGLLPGLLPALLRASARSPDAGRPCGSRCRSHRWCVGHGGIMNTVCNSVRGELADFKRMKCCRGIQIRKSIAP